MKKRKLMLLLVLAVVSLTLSTVALAVYNHTYHFTGTVLTEKIEFYSDPACTEPVPDPHSWGSIGNETITIYAKNTGDVTVHVILTVSNEVNCTVTLDPVEFTLAVAGTQPVEMDATVTAPSGSGVSWDLDVSATKV